MNQADGIAADQSVFVSTLRFEHLREAIGIGVSQPRLSWIVETDRPDWRQAGYEIEAVAPNGDVRGQTGKVASDQSVLVPWPFAPLRSRERYMVRVRVWGEDEVVSEWSHFTPVEAGLLTPADWSASFITPTWEEDNTHDQPSPMLRRDFEVRAGVQSARLYCTSLGVYEAQINGERVGDHILDPGWSVYHERLRYQTFDVTELIQEGRNAIGAILGDGWYRGRLGFMGGRRNLYGDRLALLAQLEIVYEDGSTARVVSDETWRAATGPILASSLYDGETYDACLERDGWSRAGYDDSEWQRVQRIERDLATLAAPTGPPVRRIQEVQPVATIISPSGRTLLDFGQNLVGWLRITVEGTAGQTVTLRHAEVLEHGELGTRPLRFAAATDRYTLSGKGQEVWEPRFTYHGFRYAEIENWPGEIAEGSIVALVLHSDMERTGWFSCSDPLINRLHENVLWSMRGNFFDLPTDCPQRDERLGWTGDLTVFVPTASFLYDVYGFLQSWLAELVIEQRNAGGIVPPIIPNVMPFQNAAAVWGDAAVIVPWTLYQRYGDAAILSDQFESMRAWVDVVSELAGADRLWDEGFQFGDWLDPASPPDSPGEARTSRYLVATAYFARTAELLARAAGVIGKKEEEAHYGALAAEVRAAFAREFVTPAGRLMNDAETAYSLAIAFGLLSDQAQRSHAGKRLAEMARAKGYLISTGFAGTPLICDALCSVGEVKAAFRLLTQRALPSWLYPVTMGATTIWERWDSMLPDGSINSGEMTSFNHYALGAIADWLHRFVAGLAPLSPGYRHIAISPHPGSLQPGRGLTHARAQHLTPYGMASCAWQIVENRFEIEVIVPPNCRATVTLPQREAEATEVASGTHHWSYLYQVEERPAQALTLDSAVGDVIDDAEAWAVVLPLVQQYASRFRGADGTEQMPLRRALMFHPNSREMLTAIEDALARVSASRQERVRV